MERLVEIVPAYDKRDKNPAKNYGIHGVDLRFILKGQKGAVQFVIYTNWQLPYLRPSFDTKVSAFQLLPIAADVGYHSPVPHYEGQDLIEEACPYLDNRPCYYDGSGLHAEKLFDIMVELGGEVMWAELQKYYEDVFNSKE